MCRNIPILRVAGIAAMVLLAACSQRRNRFANDALTAAAISGQLERKVVYFNPVANPVQYAGNCPQAVSPSHPGVRGQDVAK